MGDPTATGPGMAIVGPDADAGAAPVARLGPGETMAEWTQPQGSAPAWPTRRRRPQ